MEIMNNDNESNFKTLVATIKFIKSTQGFEKFSL